MNKTTLVILVSMLSSCASAPKPIDQVRAVNPSANQNECIPLDTKCRDNQYGDSICEVKCKNGKKVSIEIDPNPEY